ncbi:hypothetical protein MTY414_77920 [Mycolicibacterium mageritense]|nr:hypothetical protein MTY414_77920 [Mycolicibacterium mageritense]
METIFFTVRSVTKHAQKHHSGRLSHDFCIAKRIRGMYDRVIYERTGNKTPSKKDGFGS